MANSEVQDLMDNTLSCQNLAPFAKMTKYATGGLVDGVPLICGGRYSGFYDECYSITKSLTSFVTTMTSKRAYAASLVLEKGLWMMGGYDGSSYLSSSEYVQISSGSSSGPNLPYAVGNHAVVAWSSTYFMLTGGRNVGGVLSKTFYYHEDNPEWIPGPEMKQARKFHAAGLGMDQATNDPYIAVTAGVGFGIGYLDSVELLYEGETEWQAGKHQ